MGKPTVELVVAGDSSKLSKAFGEVGEAAGKMSAKVESASEDMQKVGRSSEDLADKAGTGEQRFIGFKDSITGAQDVMKGFSEGSVLTMAQGFADLAGGLESFVIPMIGQLATGLKVGLGSAMTFIAAHPLLITFGLLTAAFVLLWMNSEKFRDIVIGVFNTVGDFAKRVFGGAIDWIMDRWNGMVDWFGKLPERIGRALGSIGNFIGDAFKGGLNVAIGFLNWGIDRINDLIYRANVINPFENIPYISHIPKLHTGGVLPGAPGEESLFIGLAGEPVGAPGSIPHGGNGGLTINVTGSGALFEAIQAAIRDGDIQLEGR